MSFLSELLQKLRRATLENSRLCDGCGREVFSYPHPRLCVECLSKLTKSTGHVCDKCGRIVRGAGVCQRCKTDPPRFTKGVAPLVYFDETATLVNRFKNGKRHLAYFFAEEIEKVLPRLPKAEELTLVSVPLTPQKRRQRGYNQSEELVFRLSELTGYPVRTDLLIKQKQYAQKHLSAKERREHIKGSFKLVDRRFCKGKTFLVVDDILTSGATLSEIGRLFSNAGAKAVYVAVVAAVPDRDRNV